MKYYTKEEIIDKIVNTPSKVVESIPYNQEYYTWLAERQNEIIDLINDME